MEEKGGKKGKKGKREKGKKVKNNPKQTKNKTHECLNNIHIRFPTYKNEGYSTQTRILRTMPTMGYIYISCARVHMCKENIGTRM